jgi:hypothetical protein
MSVRVSNTTGSSRLLRVRIVIVGSDPEIWRLIDVDSSLTLDKVHEVIQRAIGWRDSHLHAFTDIDPFEELHAHAMQGREPRQWHTQNSLDNDLEGLLETEWTLGQVLTESSGPLFYEYDFGDGWTHRLELIDVIAAAVGQPLARVVEAVRHGPVEDSGGIGGYADLLDALADHTHERHYELTEWVAYTFGSWQEFDPDAVDVDQINRELDRLFSAPNDELSSTEALSLLNQLTKRMPPGLQREFRSFLRATDIQKAIVIDVAVAERMVAPYLWLLRRIGVDGLQLTSAGWLPPVVVSDAMRDLDWGWRWIGAFNREELTRPIAILRESAQRLGLIRKLKGKLVLGPAAKKLLDDPVGLWFLLARSLAHRQPHDYEKAAALLLALEITVGKREGKGEYLQPVSFGLSALGWTTSTGWNLPEAAVADVIKLSWEVLFNLGVFVRGKYRHEVIGVTPEGRTFARAVLQA